MLVSVGQGNTAASAALDLLRTFHDFGIRDRDGSIAQQLEDRHTAAAAAAAAEVTGTKGVNWHEFDQALLLLLQLIGKQRYPHAGVSVMNANTGQVCSM